MRVTVKEAAQLLCPFIRDWDYPKYPEGAPPVYDHIKCRSTACMGWRWDDLAGVKNPEVRRGYCGAAGDRPEL